MLVATIKREINVKIKVKFLKIREAILKPFEAIDLFLPFPEIFMKFLAQIFNTLLLLYIYVKPCEDIQKKTAYIQTYWSFLG